LHYFDFLQVEDWLAFNPLILLIDELNVIAPDTMNNGKMSVCVDAIMGRFGSSVCHQQETADDLHGRPGIAKGSRVVNNLLSIRVLEGTMSGSPSRESGLKIGSTAFVNSRQASQESMWSAVLHRRMPCLFLLQGHKFYILPDIICLRDQMRRQKKLS
jgi:hypothetical protein